MSHSRVICISRSSGSSDSGSFHSPTLSLKKSFQAKVNRDIKMSRNIPLQFSNSTCHVTLNSYLRAESVAQKSSLFFKTYKDDQNIICQSATKSN